MPRKKAVTKSAPKGEELEGFQPQPLSRVLGPTPSSVAEETTKKVAPTIYTRNEDVPEEMRVTHPPSRDSGGPNAPSMRESSEAIQAMLDGIAKKRRDKAVEEAREPARHRVVREAAESREQMVKVNKEKADDGEKASRPTK